MTEVYEDFKNKANFLDTLGLNSVIKTEKAVESGTSSANFKISLNEIIVIDDDEEEASGCSVVPKLNIKSKLLTKSSKASKSKDFTKGVRGKSKKLLMLDISSPLGRKIDFSSGKGRNKTPLECVNGYEKWCCNGIDKFSEEERRPRHRSCKIVLKMDPKYNFRRRSKRTDQKQLSKYSELLLHSMKPCSVVLSQVKNVNLTGKTKVRHDSDGRNPDSFVRAQENDRPTFVNGFGEFGPPEVQGNGTPTFDDTLTECLIAQAFEDEPLIERVYSLAPGMSPHLPIHLLEVGQNLIKSKTHRADPTRHTSGSPSKSQVPPPFVDSSDLFGRLNGIQIANQNGRSGVIPCEGRNINIIDLCDVENEDCFMVDPAPRVVRNTNGTKGLVGQPLQQVAQCRFAADKGENRDVPHPNSHGDVRLLSFLCRICNEVIKCRGFYKADMVKHYAVKHNIANVNLVSHIHNGKLVWKVVEEPTFFSDVSVQRSRKRRKENQSLSELEQPSKMIHLDPSVVPVAVPERMFVNPEKDKVLSAHPIGPCMFSSDIIPGRDRSPSAKVIGANMFTSDVICID